MSAICFICLVVCLVCFSVLYFGGNLFLRFFPNISFNNYAIVGIIIAVIGLVAGCRVLYSLINMI